MVSKRTGRPVGRPRKLRPLPPTREQKLARKFLRDPDRYAVALLDALLALELGSERACAMAVAVHLVGVAGEPPRPSARHPGLVETNWERFLTRKGAKAATLEGRAATLRVKQQRNRTLAEAIWRVAMKVAFMHVLRPPGDNPKVKGKILLLAETVGECEFARTVMWPMLEGKTASPEFLAKTVSTTSAH